MLVNLCAILLALSICVYEIVPILSVGMMAGLIVILVAHKVVQNRTIRIRPEMGMLLAYSILSLAGSFFVNSRSDAIRYSLYYAAFVVVYILLADEAGWQRSFISTILLLVMGHALIILWSAISWSTYLPFAERILSSSTYAEMVSLKYVYGGLAGITGQVGTAANYMGIGAIIAIAQFITEKRKSSFLFLIVFILCIFMTGKRSSLVIMPFIFVMALIIENKARGASKKKSVTASLILSVAILVIVIYLLAAFIPDVNNVIVRLFSSAEEDASSGRLSRYVYAWRVFLRSPMFGSGTMYVTRTHNDYLQILANNGVIGLFFYVGSYILVLINGIRAYVLRSKEESRVVILDKKGESERDILLYAILSILMMLIFGMVGSVISNYAFMSYYLICCAIISGNTYTGDKRVY